MADHSRHGPIDSCTLTEGTRKSDFPDKPSQIKKKPIPDPKEKSSDKTRTKKKHPPRVIAVEIDEPLSPISLEALKDLIRKAALRKLKELEKDT